MVIIKAFLSSHWPAPCICIKHICYQYNVKTWYLLKIWLQTGLHTVTTLTEYGNFRFCFTCRQRNVKKAYMYLQGNKEYISSNAYALSYVHACMITLTLKSYSGQLIFDPDSIVSSLILQFNIMNLLHLYSFN